MDSISGQVCQLAKVAQTTIMLMAILVVPAAAIAQDQVGVFPAPPGAGQDLVVVVAYTSPVCGNIPALTDSFRTGNIVVVQLEDAGCPFLPCCFEDYELTIPISPLPVGTYTLEVRGEPGVVIAATDFTVYPPDDVFPTSNVNLEIGAGSFAVPEGETVLALVSGVIAEVFQLGEINIDTTPSSNGLRLASIDVDIDFLGFSDPPIPASFRFPLELGPLPVGKYELKTSFGNSPSLTRLNFLEVLPSEQTTRILNISPTNATATDQLTALVRLPGTLVCDPDPSVSVGAGEVTIEIDSTCINADGPESIATVVANFGPLPPGPTTVSLYDHLGSLIDQVEIEIEPAGGCTSSDTTLCLHRNRFEAKVLWSSESDTHGPGHVQTATVGPGSSSGALWFFEPSNVELDLKLIDGCALNGHYWLFAAGLTDVGVRLKVEDTVAGGTKVYTSPLGEPFEVIRDVEAFSCGEAQ